MRRGLQTQPIVVDDVLYGVTPSHKAFALRAATGEHLWLTRRRCSVPKPQELHPARCSVPVD